MQRQYSPVPVLVVPLAVMVTAIVLAAAAALVMSISTAHAEIDGACEATIAGVDVRPLDPGNRDDDIHVGEDLQVLVTATSAAGFESHKIELEFAGTRWTVSDEADDGSTSWSDTVNVDDYATYGVGLYKVIGVSTLSDGTTCEGSAVVDVDGNPLTTVAGGVALGGGILAVGGAVATTTRSASVGRFGGMVDMVEEAFREEQRAQQGGAGAAAARPSVSEAEAELRSFGGILPQLFGWCVLAIPFVLVLPLLALAGGGDEPKDEETASQPASPTPSPAPQAEPEKPSLPKPPWVPRITLVGLLSGFIAGVAAVVLMQQYSIEYPTLAVVLRTVIVLTLIGGIVLPTLGMTYAWFRARSKVAEWERELGWRE